MPPDRPEGALKYLPIWSPIVSYRELSMMDISVAGFPLLVAELCLLRVSCFLFDGHRSGTGVCTEGAVAFLVSTMHVGCLFVVQSSLKVHAP